MCLRLAVHSITYRLINTSVLAERLWDNKLRTKRDSSRHDDKWDRKLERATKISTAEQLISAVSVVSENRSESVELSDNKQWWKLSLFYEPSVRVDHSLGLVENPRINDSSQTYDDKNNTCEIELNHYQWPVETY